LGVAAPARAAGSITAFTVDSDPGAYVGVGETLTYTSDNATIAATGDSSLSMSAIQGNYMDHYWYANLAPPTGGSFVAGVTYSTTRFPSDSTAGLDVYGDGRGCSASSGSLKVLEVSFGGEGVVDAFAATYEQHCEDETPALFGELRYKSSIDFRAVSIDPTTIDFGPQPRVPSDSRPITITNTGTTSVGLGGRALTGAQAADYSITSDTCSNATLAVGAACTIQVVFTPSDTTTRDATLTLSADTARGAVTISLTGLGVILRTSVSLTTSERRVVLDGPVTVIAHLAHFKDTISRHLVIYAKAYGGANRLIKSANVNASGDLSVTVKLSRRTTFVATFAGDRKYAAATSSTETVYVYPVVIGTLARYDGTSGRYKLYRYASTCPGSHKGCPTYIVSVKPNHARSPVSVTLQVYAAGAWRTALTDKLTLNAKSKAGIVFYYRDARVIGLKTRVLAEFKGDADHAWKQSKWSYFKVTS
jgi:hypothetical protein